MTTVDTRTRMRIPWNTNKHIFKTNINRLAVIYVICICIFSKSQTGFAQDENTTTIENNEDGPPLEMEQCNGIFLSYNFGGREKEYPRLKNVTAQSWAFKANAMIVNAGTEELRAWQMYIGFQNKELIVSADGALPLEGDFPVLAGNGTTFVGSDKTDLKTSIETAGDFEQISAKFEIIGTLFGVKPAVTPMPRTIRLVNDGFHCPAPKREGAGMHVCCKKNLKFKAKDPLKRKYMPRRQGDLNIVYDVLQSFSSNYLAQVTIDNSHPLGRLDHWNLTWEWTRGEFIQSMRGAFTHKRDPSACLYSKAGLYYSDMDFSQVMNCEKRPAISDLPPQKKEDEKIGKLPFCCKNGTLLPSTMDPSSSRSVFQLQVYKVPPDLNRTTFYPPQRWKIDGVINPQYKCGAPVRVDPTPFPDPSGLQAITFAIASWQVVCNITKPKEKESKCCVSFSAFYNDSAIPCNTCACGCGDIDTDTCNADIKPMLLPTDALLVPFENRTLKAKAWAKQKHMPIPKRLPCPDNCGVSINWHVNTDYKNGWTARITIFNWRDFSFQDWFAAIDMGKSGAGYEAAYSFNGSRLENNNHTIFLQGLPGMNYLSGEMNGTNPKKDPLVPGKQQTVISFNKKNSLNLNIAKGDGFPKRVFFNGEECSLPVNFPRKSGGHRTSVGFFASTLMVVFIVVMVSFPL